MTERRDDEQVAADHGRDRIPGQRHHRRLSYHAERHRLARPNRHSVQHQLAGGPDRLRGEVPRAGGDPRQWDHKIRLLTCLFDGPANGIRVIANWATTRNLSAIFGQERGNHRGVEVGNVAWPRGLARRDDLLSGGDDRDPRRPQHFNREHPCGEKSPDVDRTEPLSRRNDNLGGDHIFADQSRVLPGDRGGDDLEFPRRHLRDVFDHDDGIGVLGQRITSVHVDGLSARSQSLRRGLRCPGAVGRAHCDAVHGCGVIVRG